MIETLFPPGVVTQTATAEMWSGTLLPEEAACLSPRAVARRRREFAAGRVCARAALARLGVRDFPLLAGPDRAPIWPPEIVGSLSHCADYCGVAVARRGAVAGLGLDVEGLRPLAGRVVELVCREDERRHLASLPGPDGGLWAVVVFCAKESVYKCYYPATGVALGFHDVAIRIDPRAGRFTAVVDAPRRSDAPARGPGPRLLEGRFARDDEHVFAGVTLTTAGFGPPVDDGEGAAGGPLGWGDEPNL